MAELAANTMADAAAGEGRLPAPWDLVVAGHQVETLTDLIAWLNAGELAPEGQVVALSAFLSMNRRRIPAKLMLEVARFIVETEHKPIRSES